MEFFEIIYTFIYIFRLSTINLLKVKPSLLIVSEGRVKVRINDRVTYQILDMHD